MENNIQFEICGSYRRGKMHSGDIDILLTCSTWDEEKSAIYGLRRVLTELCDEKLLVDHLTDMSKAKTKYMGFLKIPDYDFVCRVDIRTVVYSQYIYALAYFTGSREENQRLRNLAKKKNLKLNEYGLIDESGSSFVSHITSEEMLYSALGTEYISPVQR
jgi:DNA polymerase/3'-5' exonuclease PolX